MALEFALRPRIRLSEGFAPPRRSRWRLPKLALPIALYWSGAAWATYALMHLHDPSPVRNEVSSTSNTLRTPNAPAAFEQLTQQRGERADDSAPSAARAPSVNSTSPPIVNTPSAVNAPELTVTNDSQLVARSTSTHSRWAPATAATTAQPPESRARASTVGIAMSDDALTALDHATLNEEPDLALAPAAPEPALPRAPSRGSEALVSCEAARAAENAELDITHPNATPDLPREVLAAILDNGAWLSSCAIPESTAVDVCVAVKAGRVVGATVVSQPPSSGLTACVRRNAAALHFPFSSRLDLAKTHFDVH